MNFFDHQEQARKKTGRLLVLFVLAVISLIAMTTLLVAAFLGYLTPETSQTTLADHIIEQINNRTLVWVALAVTVVVGLGSWYKLSQLSAGGKAVAEMLGGILVEHSTRDKDERKLLNIVEEMAIASGSPVPPVYLLDDSNINAFAAGFNFNDAVIGVTRGCIEQLNRDELQGVIAHEFSHIFHGDMRINMQLIGILHGILLIGLIGYYLLDKLWYINSRNSNDKGKIGIIALALGLIVIGFGGLFFGNLIKSAVSRQREFLADASAVRFTRNPGGIANALKRIGGFSDGARLHGKHVAEASHLFFGEATRSLFATHPPLSQRIKRVQPNWDGEFLAVKTIKKPTVDKETQQDKDKGLASVISTAILAEQALQQVGNIQSEHIDYAKETLISTPKLWLDSAHNTEGAKALIFALLIDKKSTVIAEQQYQKIDQAAPYNLSLCQQLAAIKLKPEYRLTLLDIALPNLAKMSKSEFNSFHLLLDTLINIDDHISLFEWFLSAILMHYLQPLYGKIKAPISQYRQLDQVAKSCQIVFSILAIIGNSASQQQHAFQQAITTAKLDQLSLLPEDNLDKDLLTLALKELNKLYPLVKPLFLKSCIAGIVADGKISIAESELIRAIADTLDCPMPPLLMQS